VVGPNNAQCVSDGTFALSCTGAGGCRRAHGQPCTSDAECTSNVCSDLDGVCCDQECTGACVSCLAAITGSADGYCLPTATATDPEDDCSNNACCQGAATCGGGGC
jgi:hypothetical protein